MTSPLATTFDCPNTRKNKRDYAALNKYGFLAEDIPLPPPRKKMTVRSAVKSPTPSISTSPTAPSNVSMSLSNLDTDMRPSQSISQVECEVERIEIKQKDETRSNERSWVWKHYLTTPESGTWRLGNKERFELKHLCIVSPSTSRFFRFASKLRSSTTALKQHLQQTHKLFQDGHSGCQGPLSSWISKEKKPPFQEAALNWTVSTCQPFTCVEQPSFKAMLRSAGFQDSVPSADTASRRLCLRLDALDSELRTLMSSASSIALSLDGWTSQNSLPMLAINAHWMSSAFQQYRACIEFVGIEGSHSGENLANIVATVLERFHISDKVMTITADNASNNDTLHRYLYQKLSQRSHKEACDLLDDVAKRSWKTANPPTSPIAKLRLLVLWIARSPQRIQKWDNRPGCTKAINYDVDTRWNSTFVMIVRAEEYRRQLEDTVNDDPDIEALRLTPNDWRQLSDIKKILAFSANIPSMSLGIALQSTWRRTKWLKTLSDGEKIIDRIREFLKKAYSTTKQPVSIAPSTNWMSFEYRFLEAFQPTQYYVAESDIDKYFDTPTVSTGCDISRSQSEFIRNWWKASMLEYSCMAKVAQDHLAIPAAEVDIERLFNGGRDVLGIRRFSMKGKTLGGSPFIAM
ncbi:hypothetical protein N7489_004782 [Penicillium chrysogenum]|uniref:uncharacterized protein n=1 Tax=Penicillium chrysogenum TaxID=5076 RepID=UPI0024DF1F5B|nr:uncharacterized protein N7489_004782 [Penicillium chrysogenum]KAJ5244686.1 hypothetical protein N7489_004782 [Penicillium chrysogenum]